MGYYLNPKDMSKESWLALNGEVVRAPTWPVKEGFLPVCLVNNGPFTAAGVAFSESEFNAFARPSDLRPKIWYLVQTEKLLKEIPELAFELKG